MLSAGWGGLVWFGEQIQSLFPKMLPILGAWSGPMLPFIYWSLSGQECCTKLSQFSPGVLSVMGEGTAFWLVFARVSKHVLLPLTSL